MYTDRSKHSDTFASVLVQRHLDWVSSTAPGHSSSHPLITASFVEVNYVLVLLDSLS